MPDKVNAELREYQKQGVNWLWFMYSYGLNGILADDMGLGKTLQALVLLQMAKDKDGQQPSLVVCPSSIVFNWMAEAEKFTPELKVIDHTVRTVGTVTYDETRITSVSPKIEGWVERLHADFTGAPVARGLVNYDAVELPGLLGRSTGELAAALGPAYEREVVHRDDLVLL